jgi:hypothetical protein
MPGLFFGEQIQRIQRLGIRAGKGHRTLNQPDSAAQAWSAGTIVAVGETHGRRIIAPVGMEVEPRSGDTQRARRGMAWPSPSVLRQVVPPLRGCAKGDYTAITRTVGFTHGYGCDSLTGLLPQLQRIQRLSIRVKGAVRQKERRLN